MCRHGASDLPSRRRRERHRRPAKRAPVGCAVRREGSSADRAHRSGAARPIVLAGDGDGIVDASAAGLVDGRALLLSLPALDDRALKQALQQNADLILTDSNRRRAEQWFFSVTATRGRPRWPGRPPPTPAATTTGSRSSPVPPMPPDGRGTTRWSRFEATGDGGPADRRTVRCTPSTATSRTIWRVGGEDPTGQRITLTTAKPVRADRVTLVQPQEGPRDRVLTERSPAVRRGRVADVALGPEISDGPGPGRAVPGGPVRRLEIELLATTKPPFDPRARQLRRVLRGRLGNVRVTPRPYGCRSTSPQRAGAAAAGHRLDVVLSRLRVNPSDREPSRSGAAARPPVSITRTEGLWPDRYRRVNPNAPDDVLDDVLGTTTAGVTLLGLEPPARGP